MYCSDRKITKILQNQPLREKKMLKYTLIYRPCTTLTPPPPLWFTRPGRGTTAGPAGGRHSGRGYGVRGPACAARPVLSRAGIVIGRARPITVTPPPAGTRAAPAGAPRPLQPGPWLAGPAARWPAGPCTPPRLCKPGLQGGLCKAGRAGWPGAAGVNVAGGGASRPRLRGYSKFSYGKN